MSDLEIGPGLVGQRVRNAARPEWGAGTVLDVHLTTVNGQPAQRVSIQFEVGHRIVIVPPGQLVPPTPEPQRESGWLPTIEKQTLDDRLRALPAAAIELFGTLRERIRAVAALYECSEDPASLSKWAQGQTGVADPLSHWSRDELLVAFRAFCDERDAHFRVLAARLIQAEGRSAFDELLQSFPRELSSRVAAALQRPL